MVSVGSCSFSGVRSDRPLPEGTAAQEYEGYELVWSDEFDEPGRPADCWSYEEGFVRNNELQWYQSDNASVHDGCLVITARNYSRQFHFQIRKDGGHGTDSGGGGFMACNLDSRE